MRCLDLGHAYDLSIYDGEGGQRLVFMKREGNGYPFNVGHHPGTNCQEVIRALIERVKYLQMQIPCTENQIILGGLRTALLAFESRAANRHGRTLSVFTGDIEDIPSCSICGHIACDGHKE